ncbi:sensor histidine kinase [Blautia sp. MSJ-19]|uniref:sensor histidine kinase n=1 Tax=Blautia sp. MSJ-19 TaxID=2841517 RepID=UPI001C0EA07F|nr:ATP-binding protein [Blautia sp. MSJ-19]MBU5481280.1 two-component sensor histidine kinase [Blautia sp. MSJ-19]
MRKKILNHTCVLVVVSVLLTFLAAGLVMYSKYNEDLKESVRDSTKYIQDGVEKMGNSYLDEALGKATSARITLLDPEGNVLFDSLEDSAELANHSNRPEFIQAEKNGYAESLRYSETLSKQNFYCAVKLADGDILRVGRTTDSVFSTMLSSSALLGGLLLLILAMAFVLVQKQTKDLIEPINTLNLEKPLEDVKYEELRPLLGRVDQQNKQIARQLEELKEAEAVRREFSANVSHELKTPLMSISGYAELMMNGMVPDEKVPEFSGRIYHEASRLSNLVADIIQLSRLDEKSSDLPFEPVDLYEIAEDIVLHLDSAASKKNITVSLEGESVIVEGVRHVIYEMLYNIADNAIRYTEQDGTVKIFTGTIGTHPFYRVEDNGIGIPENEQKRIFERFYRVDKSHSRATGGTGLGLSIVKHGAILHKAEIRLDSTPGKGTKMELVF